MARPPLDCPGSWMPISHLKPGDKVGCPLCGKPVFLSVPPEDRNTDPWAGSAAARVQVHWTEWKPPPQ